MPDFTQQQKKRLYEIASRTPSVMPFPGDSPARRNARRARVTGTSWAAFSEFVTCYLPFVTTKPFARCHPEIYREIRANTNGLTGLTGFRGLSKTVLFSLAYQLHELARGAKYIVNVGGNESAAIEKNTFVYQQLTTNRRLMNDFPDLAIIEGDEGDFYCKNGARVRARSIRQFRRGTLNPRTAKRPDLVMCDDIDSEDNIGSKTIGKRKLEKIKGDILGSLDPEADCRVIWMGNLTHPNFAICQLEDEIADKIKEDEPDARPDDRKHLKHGKTVLLRYPVEDAEGHSVWPEQYSDESLKELRRTMGTTTYLREMLGRKIIEGLIFKYEWFKKWAVKHKKRQPARLYADLAPGQKNCYKALIGGFKDERKYYVTHVRVRQEKNSAFFRAYYDAFQDLKHRYGSRFRASVEGNFDQYRSFMRDFRIWQDEEKLDDITKFIGKYNNKGQKNQRIESTETVIEQGYILLPDGQDTKTLVEQYIAYPDGYVDGPDAVEGWLQQFPGYSPKRGKARVRSMLK